MGQNVILLSDIRKKAAESKIQQGAREETSTEINNDFVFSQIMQSNLEKQEKQKLERLKSNEAVLKSCRINPRAK